MLGALKRTYTLGWAFARALPLLVLLAIGFEALQHVVEWRSGMYVSKGAALATQGNVGRMVAGGAKVLILVAFQYWLARFALSARSATAALRYDPVALGKYAFYMLYEIIAAFVVTGGSMLLPGSGLTKSSLTVLSILFVLVSFVLGVLFTPWSVAAAVGDDHAGPLWSTRIAARSFLWGLAFSLLVALPVLIVHYALGFGAIGKAVPVAITMLTFDAVFVGVLAAVVAASRVVMTEYMLTRAGAAPLRLGTTGDAKRVAA